MKRLKLGMVGGGQGAFIGGVHRIAARIDDRFELVAGAFSSDPERARTSAQELGVSPDRAYTNFEEMAQAEAARADGIDAVSIVTPNHLHAAPAIAFLNAGIHVICDKPLAATMQDAVRIHEATERSKARFFLTHNYSGYPLIRMAKEMVARGDLGEIRVIQAQYAQDWLAEPIELEGQKQASWRTDPKAAGAGAIGDIGTHAFQLINFVTGLEATTLCAELHRFVDGRAVDDNAHIMMRYNNEARAMLWVSQVATGCENNLSLRIYGTKASVEWQQEQPNQMRFTRLGEAPQILSRGMGESAQWTRIPPGHPEGYLEGFANLYHDIAAILLGETEANLVPNIIDGMAGMRFIQACLDSQANENQWVSLGG